MMNHVVIISKKEGGQWKFVAARPGVPQEEGAMRDHTNSKPAKPNKGQ
jgi:hypothetical protein